MNIMVATRRWRGQIGWLVLFAGGVLIGTGSVAAGKDTVRVEILDPAPDGVTVGKEALVKGTAILETGQHVWVLLHRTAGFEGQWWPQGEARVDPKTGAWEVNVVVGGPQDVGYAFELAAIVVNAKDDAKLQEYRKTAMEKGTWPPIEMPPTVVPPAIRTVKKSSDR